jgi:hypothetical protein
VAADPDIGVLNLIYRGYYAEKWEYLTSKKKGSVADLNAIPVVCAGSGLRYVYSED